MTFESRGSCRGESKPYMSMCQYVDMSVRGHVEVCGGSVIVMKTSINIHKWNFCHTGPFIMLGT